MDIHLASVHSFLESHTIDGYDELVWVDRFNNIGEFSLKISFDKFDVFNLIDTTTSILYNTGSRTVMRVENIEVSNNIVTLSGRSMELYFKYRFSHPPASTPGNTDPLQYTASSPSLLVRQITNDWVTDPALPQDSLNILGNVAGNPQPPGSSLTMYFEFSDVLTMIKSVLDSRNILFILEGNRGQTGQFRLSLEACNDYTTGDGEYREYSKDSENLKDVSLFKSTANNIHQARVFGFRGQGIYSKTLLYSGWDKKNLVIYARGVGSGGMPHSEELSALMDVGRKELRKIEYSDVLIVEGNFVPTDDFPDNSHKIGDIAWFKFDDDNKVKTQLIEITTSVDASGTKKTPTFVQID